MGQLLSKTALSSVLALSLLASPRAWAFDRAVSHEPLRVAVDTSTLAEADRERIQKFVLAGVVEEVEGKGIDVVDDGTATTLRIRIEYLDQEDLEFAVHYDIQRAGEIHTDVPWVACTFCVDAKLLRAVNDGLAKALERIDEFDEPIGVDEPDPVEEPVPGHEATIGPIGPIGITGAALAGSGLALTLAGAIELSRGEELLGVGERSQRFRDHQQPGQILLATGASVLVVGVVMLAVDLAVRAKRRKKIDASARMLVPVLGPDFAGVGYGQRF